MKKLNINLSDLSGKELNAREQHSLRGGDLYYESCCNCACCYQGEEGGSDIVTNAGANSLQCLLFDRKSGGFIRELGRRGRGTIVSNPNTISLLSL